MRSICLLVSIKIKPLRGFSITLFPLVIYKSCLVMLCCCLLICICPDHLVPSGSSTSPVGIIPTGGVRWHSLTGVPAVDHLDDADQWVDFRNTTQSQEVASACSPCNNYEKLLNGPQQFGGFLFLFYFRSHQCRSVKSPAWHLAPNIWTPFRDVCLSQVWHFPL